MILNNIGRVESSRLLQQTTTDDLKFNCGDNEEYIRRNSLRTNVIEMTKEESAKDLQNKLVECYKLANAPFPDQDKLGPLCRSDVLGHPKPLSRTRFFLHARFVLLKKKHSLKYSVG